MANHTIAYCAVAEVVTARDGRVCHYCGTTQARHVVMEYVIPEADGGPSAPYNLVVACRSCNNRKGAQTGVPRNIEVLAALNPIWAALIRTYAARPAAVTRPVYKVSSYRIDPALARRVKVYAAMHDLNDYEVGEAALTAWLDAREWAEG